MSILQTAARQTANVFGHGSWVIRRLRPAYESILQSVSGDDGVDWMINGVSFRVTPQYRHQLPPNHDAAIASFLRKRVRPGAVCVNVGANVGVYVLQFANWSGPDGQVIAFEPNPVARKALLRHVELNHLQDRTLVSAAAVGDRLGRATLYAADADGMSRLGAPNKLISDRTSPVEVEITTLDVFFAQCLLRPDWMLIDIEGYEIAALEGARKLIERRGAGLNIVVEMHPDVWASANTSRERAESILSSLGRRPVPLSGQRDPLGEYGLVYLAMEGADI